MKSSVITLTLVILTAVSAAAQGAPYRNQVIATGGFPFPTVRVCTEPAVGTPCTPLASIFSDPGLTTPLANPFTGDWDGVFTFYGSTTGVTYHVQVSGSGLVAFDIPNITLGGGGGGAVTGTPNQIAVTGSVVSLANPVVLPGPISGPSGSFSTLQGTFPVNGVFSNLVIGHTITNPCCALPEGSVWILDLSINGAPHICYYDGNGYACALTNNDTPANMANGVTGSGPTALQTSPSFVTPFIDNATGTSITLANTTGDWQDVQQGTVTPFIQQSPAAGHIKQGFGSDSRWQISEGTGDQSYYDATQTVAKGTAAMTTGLIAGGSCGTTVTVSATGVATTDTIEVSRNAAVTAGAGGILILNWWVTANNVNLCYCNPGSGNVTPSSAAVNFKVTR